MEITDLEFERQWKGIDVNFDWEAVYKTMKALDWDWRNLGGIPNVESLKVVAYDLLKRAQNDGNSHSVGGFYAEVEGGCLRLSFCVDQWDV